MDTIEFRIRKSKHAAKGVSVFIFDVKRYKQALKAAGLIERPPMRTGQKG